MRLKALLEREDVGPYQAELCRDSDYPTLRLRIQTFFDDAEYDDLLILYISGHGLKDRSNSLYFAARDTLKDKLSATAIDSRFIVERMQQSRSRQQLLFLDTCYSGAFIRGVNFKSVDADVSRDDFVGSIDGGSQDEGQTRVVVTAASAVEMAIENNAGSTHETVQSLFTRHFIAGIESGAGDPNNSGDITLDNLFRHVRAKVRAENPHQNPMCWYFPMTSPVLLSRNPAFVTDLDAELKARLADDRPMVRAESVADLLALARQPNEPRRSVALSHLAALRDDDSDLVKAVVDKAWSKLASASPLKPAATAALTPPSAGPGPTSEMVDSDRRSTGTGANHAAGLASDSGGNVSVNMIDTVAHPEASRAGEPSQLPGRRAALTVLASVAAGGVIFALGSKILEPYPPTERITTAGSTEGDAQVAVNAESRVAMSNSIDRGAEPYGPAKPADLKLARARAEIVDQKVSTSKSPQIERAAKLERRLPSHVDLDGPAEDDGLVQSSETVRPPRPPVLLPNKIYFDHNSAEITAKGAEVLGGILGAWKINQHKTLVVVSYFDRSLPGLQASNRSRDRAGAVKKWLVEKGVQASSIDITAGLLNQNSSDVNSDRQVELFIR